MSKKVFSRLLFIPGINKVIIYRLLFINKVIIYSRLLFIPDKLVIRY